MMAPSIPVRITLSPLLPLSTKQAFLLLNLATKSIAMGYRNIVLITLLCRLCRALDMNGTVNQEHEIHHLQIERGEFTKASSIVY